MADCLPDGRGHRMYRQPRIVESQLGNNTLTKPKAMYCCASKGDTAIQGTRLVRRTYKDNVVTDTDDMHFHLQVGSQRFPDQPTMGVAEHYAGLGKDMDHGSISHTPGHP